MSGLSIPFQKLPLSHYIGLPATREEQLLLTLAIHLEKGGAICLSKKRIHKDVLDYDLGQIWAMLPSGRCADCTGVYAAEVYLPPLLSYAKGVRIYTYLSVEEAFKETGIKIDLNGQKIALIRQRLPADL